MYICLDMYSVFNLHNKTKGAGTWCFWFLRKEVFQILQSMAENFHILFICIYTESQPNSLILSYKRLTGSAACVSIIQVKSLRTLKNEIIHWMYHDFYYQLLYYVYLKTSLK